MSDISRWNPFNELNTLQKAFFGDDFTPAFRGVNPMTTDVYTREGAIVVEAHVPNFKKEDIDLDVDGRMLIISASRHSKEEDTEKKYIVRESATNFQRRVSLPEGVDTDKNEAVLNDGVLTVTVPTPEAKGAKKKIDIVSSDNDSDRMIEGEAADNEEN